METSTERVDEPFSTIRDTEREREGERIKFIYKISLKHADQQHSNIVGNSRRRRRRLRAAPYPIL